MSVGQRTVRARGVRGGGRGVSAGRGAGGEGSGRGRCTAAPSARYGSLLRTTLFVVVLRRSPVSHYSYIVYDVL